MNITYSRFLKIVAINLFFLCGIILSSQPMYGQNNVLDELKQLEFNHYDGIPLSHIHINPINNIVSIKGFYDILSKGGDLTMDEIEIKNKGKKVSILYSYFDGLDFHRESLNFVSIENGIITTDKAILYVVYTDPVETRFNKKKKYKGLILRYTQNYYPVCEYDKLEREGVIRIDRTTSSTFFAKFR